MNGKNRLIGVPACTILGLAVFRAVLAGPPQPTSPPSAKVHPLCSDLRVSMTSTRDPNGMLHLKGKVFNNGPGGYSDPARPLDAYYTVITWHPPRTPAQEGDLKLYNHADLGTALAANQGKDFLPLDYQIPLFSRWGNFSASATERPAMKEITARLEKKGGVGFSSCEDTTPSNTTFSLTVQYMEKIQ